MRIVPLALCLLAVFIACSRSGNRPKTRGRLTDAERAVVSAFTDGTISRESPIRVLFVEPLVELSQLNAPVEPSPFEFHPRIDGVAVWTARNQIEFRPAERLPDGQAYAATLDLRTLSRDKLPLSRFGLSFVTMKQSFQVEIDGLVATEGDGRKQKLTGRLVTADVDSPAAIEAVLRASRGKKDLEIEWAHDANRRTHAFEVNGIVRGEDPSTLRLSWNGRPVGADEQAERDIPVPGLNTFTLDQARAVQDREHHVELRFSDPLRPQALQGLIRIGDRDDLRFAISGNVVAVYSARGFRGDQTVRVEPGIRNTRGQRLREARELTVHFEERKPQVRFVGKGVIVPTSTGLTVPVEAVNTRAVVVEAMQIPDSTMPQFLQVNALEGDRELHRVGRVVWRKALSLDVTPDKENRWVSVGLDLTPLTKSNPGGMYRLSLSFERAHVIWSCEGAANAAGGPPAEPRGLEGEPEASFWDGWEGNEGQDWKGYEKREDPCHPAYYRRYHDHDIKVTRNVLVSDLGLLAKAGEDDSVMVVVTDLRTTSPVSGAEVTIRDYQQQPLATGKTDRAGIAKLPVEGKPFLAVVRNGAQRGYLRLDDGTALSLAHFDVAGVKAPRGLKGFLYGERGVWRPGDTLHLTFILLDPDQRLAEGHPVRFDLVNSRGQLVKTSTRARSTDGFHTFQVDTPPDAPTGNYTARVTVGGATFERVLKVETIMPNRLKIALDAGTEMLAPQGRLSALLRSTWLHGAPARGLKADVELSLAATPTRFPRHPEFAFDDPTRRFEAERLTIFDGALDQTGTARIEASVNALKVAPGKLMANLTTRVFEPGGAFSTDRFSIPYSPYPRYIGIRTPRGDKTRGMLLTDVKHELGIVAVDGQGRPAPDGEVEVKLYKVDWRWWWERGEEDLSAYAEASVHTPLQSGVVTLRSGVGAWPFEIRYPEWGRYLITAADRQGGHRTGTIVYVDWPGWAGRGQKEMAGGASVLTFAPDKPQYSVGETVTLTLPTPRKGRALVSIESGSKVLRTEWIDATGVETRHSFTATAAMAPSVYAHVTLLQPHAQTGNDLPIRLYGLAPIKVVSATTLLEPVIESAKVFVPEAAASVSVREATGRAMTYTLAVVDEGLLGLTRYQTPNPWDHFYAREALAVKTWDLYDSVVGAYGAAMERMLAIGGDQEGATTHSRRANRFPPMVRFLGPFRLERGGANTHRVDIPQYVGAVRVMVVAGSGGAFGAAEKSALVRRPLMVLGTLPRVLGPEEDVALPVSVFALEPRVRDVSVSVTASGPLEVVAPAAKKLSFKATGDELVGFRLRTRSALGVASVLIRATSGLERAEQKIELDVRVSAVRAVDVVGSILKPKEAWTQSVTFPGMAGTNEATLEVSRVPPLDLGRRLEYLIRYPHGCVEQTVSSVFPQLYLGTLLELSPEMRSRVEANVKAGLERLKQFQTSEGGFGYWPGYGQPDEWASSYAGHFLVEAEKAGYLPPVGLIDQWKRFQRRRAQAWVPGPGQAELTQAYRLYTLALGGAAELGAMNQLRERGRLPLAAQWRLAAAYQLAGQPEAARALASGNVSVEPYRELAGTYGSDLRDRAMILEALVIMKAVGQIGPLAIGISETLSRNAWLSTQETAYALLALARCVTDAKGEGLTSFSYSWNGGASVTVSSAAPVVQRKLEAGSRPGSTLVVRNTGPAAIYPRLVLSGLPPVGHETSASSVLKMEIEYLSLNGAALDPGRLEQGTDFKARVKVTNGGERGDCQEVALSHVVASGWEIHNERMDPSRARTSSPFEYQDVRDDRVYTYFDLKSGETQTVELLLHASYLGKFYLPMVSAEAMYDATIGARLKGQWVQVVEPGAR